MRGITVSKCAAVIILALCAGGCLPFTVLSGVSGLYHTVQLHELKEDVARIGKANKYRPYQGSMSAINWADTGLRPYRLR